MLEYVVFDSDCFGEPIYSEEIVRVKAEYPRSAIETAIEICPDDFVDVSDPEYNQCGCVWNHTFVRDYLFRVYLVKQCAEISALYADDPENIPTERFVSARLVFPDTSPDHEIGLTS
jgi:hypothetical protein